MKKLSQLFILILLPLMLFASPVLIYAIDSTSVIDTVAGNGTSGYSGDGGVATEAQLKLPFGIALDDAGDLYIADVGDHRIRKVISSTGVITTIVGNGNACISSTDLCGDNGPAITAQLNQVSGIALDDAGNLYIADYLNQRIRKVIAATGVITTVAGDGNSCASSTSLCGDNGPAIAAQLHQPTDVAIDEFGNLYIADTWNFRIRKVIASTGIITTVAGTGTFGASGDGEAATNAQLSTPFGITLDEMGNLYIADFDNHSIRKVISPTGVITTVAGTGVMGYSGDNGPAVSAQLNGPAGVAVDKMGNLYIADHIDHRVRKVISLTGVITTVAGTGVGGYSGDNGLAFMAGLTTPFDVVVDEMENLYISDTGNFRIRKVIHKPSDQIYLPIILKNYSMGN